MSILPNEVLDKDIVFISKAAVTESSRLKLKDISYKVFPDIWDNHEKLKEGSIYLEKLYGNFTKKLGLALNKLHNLDYPYSFWEIPMASWLLYFLHPLFDRYCRLNLAIELYGKESLVLLAYKYKTGTYPGYPDFIENVCVNEQYVSAFYAEVAIQMGLQVREFTSNEPFRGRVFLGTKKFNLLSGSFYVRAYQKIKKMIWGLIMRTFCLYVKFPEKYWKEINKAERFTDEGEKVYRKFAEIYKQEDLYDTYFQEEKLLPQAN